MKLLVDIGNSRVKWGTDTDGAIEGPFALAVDTKAPADTFEAAWHDLRPDAVHYCSVAATDLPADLHAWAARQWRLDPVRVCSVGRTGALVNGYRDPASLGADRWANLVGARALLGPVDVVVVDAGTAVTVDALRGDGQHLGGAILPGLQAARQGLGAAAPALSAAGENTGLPANATADGIAAGSLLGLAGAVERVAREVGRPLQRPAWLLTGGDADTLRPWLDPCWRHDRPLTLRGLSAAVE